VTCCDAAELWARGREEQFVVFIRLMRALESCEPLLRGRSDLYTLRPGGRNFDPPYGKLKRVRDSFYLSECDSRNRHDHSPFGMLAMFTSIVPLPAVPGLPYLGGFSSTTYFPKSCIVRI
jgi:hypothetical protein